MRVGGILVVVSQDSVHCYLLLPVRMMHDAAHDVLLDYYSDSDTEPNFDIIVLSIV